VDYRTVKKEIGKGRIAPVYLCYGTNLYLQREFVSYLLSQCVDAEHRDFAVSYYDLAETPVDIVLEDAETLPFAAPRKVVVARNAMFFTGAKESKVEHNLDRLLEYIVSPADYSVVLFTVNADKLDERKKIVKTLKDRGGMVSTPSLKPEELAHWVKSQAEGLGFRFADEAAERLMVYTGGDLQTLSVEIGKLSLYAGEGGVIGPETVDQLVARTTEQNVFLLIEEVVRMRLDRAFSILYDLMKQKEEPVKIVMLLARQFRMILQVKKLGRSGNSQQQIASQIGAHPYAVKMAADQGRNYTEDRLLQLLAGLAELDYQMKVGRIDKLLGLELFLLKMAHDAGIQHKSP